MTQEKPKWNASIKRLLERSAYDLDDEACLHEICARTGLSELDVKQVLEGSEHATIESVYRIAAMLNVPPADLINQTNSILQCYSIDGGRPRTVSLTPEDRALIGRIGDLPLLYAEDLDGTYALLSKQAMVMFVNRHEKLIVDALYLLENRNSRYVRRCSFIDVASDDAAMTDDGEPQKVTIYRPLKPAQNDSNMEVLMGRVITSITMH